MFFFFHVERFILRFIKESKKEKEKRNKSTTKKEDEIRQKEIPFGNDL